MIALDPNLLVYVHRRAVPEHAAARRAIEGGSRDSGGWGIPVPCVRGFWSVVTHPAAAGRPSTPSEAASFLRSLVEAGGSLIWAPGPGFGLRLADLARRLEVRGVRVFDLPIALVAADAGASELWSHDRRFVSLPGLPVIDPLG
ncbi:MAG: PIN domain-containing protein [Deltaproteobacteria bacterium]|nr:PIN domain-containing protein [Deltaproteobacteria bacterium]